MNLVVLLGHLYSTPLLYGGEIRPVSLPTGISFVFLSAGLIANFLLVRRCFAAIEDHWRRNRARRDRTYVQVLVFLVKTGWAGRLAVYPAILLNSSELKKQLRDMPGIKKNMYLEGAEKSLVRAH